MKHVLLSLIVLFVVSSLTLAQDTKEYDEGIAKFRAKDYDGVIELYSKILNNPSHNKRFDEDLYSYRGRSYFHKGEYEKSLSDLDQSLTLNHYNKGLITWFKARCYDKLGKTAEAKSTYQEAVDLSAKNKKASALILADRAQFYSRIGDTEAANKDLAQAKSLDPSNAEIAKVTGAKATGTAARGNGTDTKKGDETKKTQVIVQSNPNQTKSTDVSNQQQTVQAAPPATSMIPVLGELYKDEKRYALVIGNSNYAPSVGVLKNPINDATDVATELRKSSFEVQLLTNATYVQIREAPCVNFMRSSPMGQ
jgi:tetratricopeptide (TPR) repeat protein